MEARTPYYYQTNGAHQAVGRGALPPLPFNKRRFRMPQKSVFKTPLHTYLAQLEQQLEQYQLDLELYQCALSHLMANDIADTRWTMKRELQAYEDMTKKAPDPQVNGDDLPF